MSYIGLSTLFKLVLYRRLHTILYVGPTIKCDDFNFWSTTSLARYKAVKFTPIRYSTIALNFKFNLCASLLENFSTKPPNISLTGPVLSKCHC